MSHLTEFQALRLECINEKEGCDVSRSKNEGLQLDGIKSFYTKYVLIFNSHLDRIRLSNHVFVLLKQGIPPITPVATNLETCEFH